MSYLTSLLSEAAVHHVYLVIISNASSLPATIVPRGVTLVELIPKMSVPANIQDRNTKWTLPCRGGKKGQGRTSVTPHFPPDD